MRNINLSNIANDSSSLEVINYCFEITLKNQKQFFLTSGRDIIIDHHKSYLPFSGLSVQEINCNESAQDTAYLHGIFEQEGINKNDDLGMATVKIFLHTKDFIKEMVTWYCSEFRKNDLEFWLKLEPEVIKYNQSLLLTYSKTCRANFGDNKCKIDKEKLRYPVKIIDITGSALRVGDLQLPGGYFTGGEALYITDAESYKAIILWHGIDQVEAEKWFLDKVKINDEIILIPGCDKKFITCCNKFNNELNFRGEPFVPEYKYLKN